MNPELKTIEDYKALLALIHEEAGKDNAPYGRSDSTALYAIRDLLDIPRYGYPGEARSRPIKSGFFK